MDFACEICGKKSSKSDKSIKARGLICRSCLGKAYRQTSEYRKSREKLEATNLARYGTKCTLSSKKIRGRIAATNLEKYGAAKSLKLHHH